MVSQLLLVASAFGFLSSVSVADSYTYQFDAGNGPRFRYVGGLIGGGFDASLTGSFDVHRVEDGGVITRFDVFIVDPLPLSPPSFLGDPTGKPLSDYLLANPVGQPVELFTISVGTTPEVSTYPRMRFSLSDFDSPSAQFRFYSGYNLFEDAPAGFTLEGGMTVNIVPEPSAMVLCAMAAISVLIRQRRRSR